MIPADRPTAGLRQTLRQRTGKNEATVISVELVGEQTYRIMSTVRDRCLSWQPGQVIGVIVDPEAKSARSRWRHYTIRSFDYSEDKFELLVTNHRSSGPGRRWVQSLEIGASFTFMGPVGGHVLIRDATEYVLVGDMTSLASIGAMVDGLGGETAVRVILAVPNPDTVLAGISGPAEVVLAVSESVSNHDQMLSALPMEISGSGRAYVTGEMQMVRSVRDELIKRGLPR